MSEKSISDRIIEIEWEMFSSVNNAGGKADCQSDYKTFRIMRLSQCFLMNPVLLGSILDDLAVAQAAGRNLMSEKYARMMETTHPEEYAQIKGQLPELDPEAVKLVDEIVSINLKWKEELDQKHPALADRGRPLRTADESPCRIPSLETYMRAELQTYSKKTLQLWHTQTMQRLENGDNEAEMNLLQQVKQYGFNDLVEAEKHLTKPA